MAWEEKPITITKWQALYHHERQVWETDYASVQTQNFDADRHDDQMIREWVAMLISEGEQRRQSHAQERSRRAEMQKRVIGGVAPTLEAEYSGLLDDLDIDLNARPLPTASSMPSPSARPRVKASDIELREIRDGTRIRVKVYPRTFVCTRCGHYQIVDNATSDLVCPCCKEKMEREGKTHGFPWLRQEALIHICPRCARVEELIPQDIQIENGLLICPRCGDHLHYYGRERVSTIRWRCRKCPQYYPQRGRGRAIDRSCSCSIWEPDEEGKRRVSKMHIDRTAASTTYALSFSLLRIKDQPISLSVLRQRHQDDKAEGVRTWHLDGFLERLNEPEREWFRQMFPIREAFLVSNVCSSTVVYGYSTHKGAGQIKEQERLPQFFRNDRTNTYRAYVVSEQGRALVVILDKERLAEAVQGKIPVPQRRSYDDLIAKEMERLNERPLFQENVDRPDALPLIASLHAIGHALLKQAVAQVGLDYFGSKILLRDGAIILYERQDIGYGGVVQLTAGAGFLELMNEVERTLAACPHDCEQGCLSCVYITDAWCMPFLPDEIERWYPPNAILLRKEAAAAMRPVGEGGE
ncbi:MAG: hypothetical protein E3J21_13080 [Anaerolineales bacterium]|nr:MAG: hypothetical protein E3J21_13080 [Anaerolineales bacterium]